MTRPLTPAEIIDKARNRVASAKSAATLDVCLDNAHGAIYTLLDLRLITMSTWRKAIASVDRQAEQVAKALETVGGAQ
ncbi:hypothetical protein D3C85_1369870 [compost metagenome]